MTSDYLDVTELSGDEVSVEQVERMCHRYYWAASFCEGKDVLEVACGAGQGLGYLDEHAKSLTAGDYSEPILAIAREHYRDRINLRQFDAQNMPFGDASVDVIILFEAIYYLPSPERFVEECRRVLRSKGKVLIATANKDLYDFNPSPYSHRYFGGAELCTLFGLHGFEVELFGYMPVSALPWRQKILRPVKRTAVRFGLIPDSMAGKKLLKKLVFGEMMKMPAEITGGMFPCDEPAVLAPNEPDIRHKVLYCVASLP